MSTVMASFGDTLREIWDDAVSTQPAPDQTAVILCGIAALLVVLAPRTWRLTRHVVTIAHEGAHGVAALLTGRKLQGIRVHSDSSGLAVSKGKARGPGLIVTVAAGYTGPAILGLGAALLLGSGHALAVLWLAVILLALLLLQIRNFYGLYAVALAGAAVFAISWWGNPDVQSIAAYAGTWFLLLAAPRPVLELQRSRRAGRAANSDADLLSRITPLPGLAWVGFFLLINLGALVLGARQLVTWAA